MTENQNKVKQKFNLIEFSLKRQKKLYLIMLLISSFCVVYALIYCTNLALLRLYNNPETAYKYVKGAELYDEVQPFNRNLFLFGIIQLALCAGCYLYFSQKRRIFYNSNYITGIAYVSFSVCTALYNIIFNVIYMLKFYKIDFKQYETLAKVFGSKYTKSPFFFVLGILLGLFSILHSLCIVGLLLGKKKERKAELEGKEKNSNTVSDDDNSNEGVTANA